MISLYLAQLASAVIGFASAGPAAVIWLFIIAARQPTLRAWKFNRRSQITIAIITLSIIYSSVRFGLDALSKQAASLAVVFLALLLFKKFYVKYKEVRPPFLYLTLIVGLLFPASVGIANALDGFNRGYFPYVEAATFALFTSPFAVFLSLQKTPLGIFSISVVGLVGILTPNLTAVFCFSLGFVCIVLTSNLGGIWKALIAAFCLLAVFLSYGISEAAYFSDRLDVLGQSDNLSVLVYQYGFRSAWDTLRSGQLFGFGFQSMGIYSLPNVYLQKTSMIAQNEIGLNKFDGGTILSKIITEMGIIGAGIVIAICVTVLRLMRDLIFAKTMHSLSFHNLLICFVLFLPVHIFVRGQGYFFLPFLLAVLTFFVIGARWDRRPPHENSGL